MVAMVMFNLKEVAMTSQTDRTVAIGRAGTAGSWANLVVAEHTRLGGCCQTVMTAAKRAAYRT